MHKEIRNFNPLTLFHATTSVFFFKKKLAVVTIAMIYERLSNLLD
jgi:abortive infection bacteriophage resistance protein